MTFLSCGESLTDLIVDELGAVVAANPGGGPANTARALAIAGASAAFFGGFSTDAFGVAQRRRLESSGVDCASCVETALPSALAVAETRGEHTTYGFHLTNTAAFAVDAGNVPMFDQRGEPFTAVHVGGLGTTVSAFSEALLAIVPTWREQHTIVSYDPNIRRGFEEAGQDAQSIASWVAAADIVKVSREDLQLLYPGRDPRSIVESWLASGPVLVVVTDGPRSITGHTPNVTVETTPPALPAHVSPIGAGDAFSAGLLISLDEVGALTSRDRLAAAPQGTLFAALVAAAGHVATYLTPQTTRYQAAQLRAS